MPIYTSSIDKPKFTDQYVVYQNEIIEIYDKQNPNRIIKSKQDIKRLYPTVFNGIGKFPGGLYQIQLEPSIPPRQMPYRPVPVHLEEQFNGKIKEMEETGVIKESSPRGIHPLDQQLRTSRNNRQGRQTQTAHLS